MDQNYEAKRRAFHRHQMGALPTLLPGLDPDPPVPLCARTQAYDETILAQLRRHGWPGTGKNKQEAPVEPPTSVKGIALARKLAKGSPLTEPEIKLIGDRITWLQRNPFRWKARGGYEALAAAHGGAKPSPTPALSPSSTSGRVSQRLPETPTVGTRNHPSSGTEMSEMNSSRATQSVSASSSSASGEHMLATPNSAPGPRVHEPVPTAPHGPDDHAAELFDTRARSAAMNRCDDALAALGKPPDSAGGSEKSGPATEGKSLSAAEQPAPLIDLQCQWIKGIPSRKARDFLFAIRYCKPRDEIELLAKALVADKAQLSEALNSSPSGRLDIIDACAKLGIDLPC